MWTIEPENNLKPKWPKAVPPVIFFPNLCWSEVNFKFCSIKLITNSNVLMSAKGPSRSQGPFWAVQLTQCVAQWVWGSICGSFSHWVPCTQPTPSHPLNRTTHPTPMVKYYLLPPWQPVTVKKHMMLCLGTLTQIYTHIFYWLICQMIYMLHFVKTPPLLRLHSQSFSDGENMWMWMLCLKYRL